MPHHGSGFIKAALVFSFGVILSFISFIILELTYKEQKFALIDEIFHIPQAKLYCKNQWTEWNPKITTLPGLYIVSYILLKPFEELGFENFCSVYALRFTNLVATVLNFFLTYKISYLLEKKYNVRSNFIFKLFTALNVAIFPPLYFFTFLYYTDVWSTTFVLLLYYLHLLERSFFQKLGALAGFMAVLMRQTNIIWVILMLIDDVWDILCKNFKEVPIQDYKYTKSIPEGKQVQILNSVAWQYLSLVIYSLNIALAYLSLKKVFLFLKFSQDNNYFCFKNNFRSFFRLMYDILSKIFPNAVICLLFVSFLIINKGIVLGDKAAHTATFHPMQNLYFLEFAAFFGCPFLIFEAVSSVKKPFNIFIIVFLIGLCAGLSETNKLEHPYLLADNRHIAFYLWKRIFGHPVFRRMIIPTYVCSAILLLRLLQRRCHFMFTVILSVCTILSLTPQYLFELRYFIVPFLMYRLQFKQSAAVFLETALFVVINAGMVYLFLNRPFVWTSEPDVKQRFIW